MDKLGISLKYIKRVLVTEGELGYEIGLHHYFLDGNRPLDIYDPTLPMAALNVSFNEKMPTVAFVDRKWYDDIDTIANIANYEKIIVSWFETKMEVSTWELQ